VTTADPPRPARSRWRNWLADHLGVDRGDVYESVARSSRLGDATYWAEIIFSAGIATLGLTLGSPAVIIGAMLIAPLMGPIMGAGLALAAGDLFLAVRSTVNIGLSSMLAVGLSMLLVIFLPFREMTQEIAARTQPNTLDLIVALFSGAVGALAVCKSVRGVATSIPGVAIAVALMPPLCVTGYGMGVLFTLDRVQGIAIVRGGGLLFLTNLVAMTFSSMLIFLALHIDDQEVGEKVRRWRQKDPEMAPLQQNLDRILPGPLERIGSLPARLILVLSLVAVVFIPLKRSFDRLAVEIRARQELNVVQRRATAAWEDLFGRSGGGEARSYIDRFDAIEQDGRLRLTVRVFISSTITNEERQRFLERLSRELGRDPSSIEVSLIEIPTSKFQMARTKPEADIVPDPLGTRLATIAGETRAAVARTRMPPDTLFLDTSVTLGSRPEVVVTYLAGRPISEDASALIAAEVGDRLALPRNSVRLQWAPSRNVLEFSRGERAIDESMRQQLRPAADLLRRYPDLRLSIQVRETNELALERTTAIAETFAAAGVALDRIRVEERPEQTRDDAVSLLIEREI
jgi:uncharacterized hydrophobic protein (TIGR00271 family)